MLNVKNVGFAIGQKQILDSIDFEAYPGEFIVVAGPNGAGKSTLLKLLSNAQSLEQGEVLWHKKPLHTIGVKASSKFRAVLTQSINISNDYSVEDIVLMGRYPHFDNNPSLLDYEITHGVMEQAKVAHYKNANYNHLSGGEQQRVQLSRVLAQVADEDVDHHLHKLLLLDEPLNNLDIPHQYNAMQLAKDFAKKGNVVIAVVHDINIASLFADKVLLLRKGEQIAYGSPEEVINATNVSLCYDFPSYIIKHPRYNKPHAYFDYKPSEKTVEKQINIPQQLKKVYL